MRESIRFIIWGTVSQGIMRKKAIHPTIGGFTKKPHLESMYKVMVLSNSSYVDLDVRLNDFVCGCLSEWHLELLGGQISWLVGMMKQ